MSHPRNSSEPLVMVGLMTGTSMDGLDICVAKVGFFRESAEAFVLVEGSVPYTDELRESVENCLSGDAAKIATTHFSLGKFIATETERFLTERNIGSVDGIGMHGQTIHHISGQSSLQIGEPSFLAHTLEVPVVSDFRAADIAAGGTGAPLICMVDSWLFQQEAGAVICLNLGGVANVTFLPSTDSGEPIIGFDTGPGMALMDEAMSELTGEKFDKDGLRSSQGVPDIENVDRWMDHPFIHAPPPKSTGRDIFGSAWLKENVLDQSWKKPDDLLSTLSFFTARTVAVNCQEFLPLDSVQQLIVSGGGVYNEGLMNHLKKQFSTVRIVTSQEYGIDPFMKEALGFAMLGAANLKGISGNLPSVTGARKPVILGKVTI
ncbi:MAG: anhydro-N-acetylmuramic acid kinase [Candidatus Neomarinimicrobiota bacterium]|nr:anhydro-N-acetylmuramic acid kinase [Candidatus Neomarinimicrobiota bacterium]